MRPIALAVTPDGLYVATSDEISGTQVRRTDTGEILWKIERASRRILLSRDATRIAFPSGSSVVVYDLESDSVAGR